MVLITLCCSDGGAREVSMDGSFEGERHVCFDLSIGLGELDVLLCVAGYPYMRKVLETAYRSRHNEDRGVCNLNDVAYGVLTHMAFCHAVHRYAEGDNVCVKEGCTAEITPPLPIGKRPFIIAGTRRGTKDTMRTLQATKLSEEGVFRLAFLCVPGAPPHYVHIDLATGSMETYKERQEAIDLVVHTVIPLEETLRVLRRVGPSVLVRALFTLDVHGDHDHAYMFDLTHVVYAALLGPGRVKSQRTNRTLEASTRPHTSTSEPGV